MEMYGECDENRCKDQVETGYCESHLQEKLDEAFESGKKQGYDEGYDAGVKEYSD